jgi:chromosomal replication initiation ATPase DnaA
VYAIKKAKEDRSKKEIEVICSYLRRIEAFKRFATDELLSLIDSLQFQKVKKGTMREFDFKHMVILLKGQVFVMTHNRLNKDSSAQIAKPIELRMDTLLDPG